MCECEHSVCTYICRALLTLSSSFNSSCGAFLSLAVRGAEHVGVATLLSQAQILEVVSLLETGSSSAEAELLIRVWLRVFGKGRVTQNGLTYHTYCQKISLDTDPAQT